MNEKWNFNKTNGFFVLPLDSQIVTQENSGVKGKNLNKLILTKFPVPNGFLITTLAYKKFVVSNNIESLITELSKVVEDGNNSSIERLSNDIRQHFIEGVFSQDIKEEIWRQYSNSFNFDRQFIPVAVRSSATVEDLPRASFAGQLETYLNVSNKEALFDSVKSCWSSLWSTRTLTYFRSKGIPLTTVSMAVIVQLMVPSEVSGVLFTANPINGDNNDIIIDSAWGLGETIVKGIITPDNFLVDKTTGVIRKYQIGKKALMTIITNYDTETVETPLAKQMILSLTLNQVSELVNISKRIEVTFDRPQDIEWAITDKKIYILQSRPISQITTKIPPIPIDDDWPALATKIPHDFDLWTQVQVGEIWPNPVSPLLWSITPLMVNNILYHSLRPFSSRKSLAITEIRWVNRFHGRVYFNEGAIVHILKVVGAPDSFIDKALGCRSSNKKSTKKGIRRFLRRFSYTPSFLWMFFNAFERGLIFENYFSQIDRWIAEFRNLDLQNLTDQELYECTKLWVKRLVKCFSLHSEMSIYAMTIYSLLEMMVKVLAPTVTTTDLVAGLSNVYVAEIGEKLWKIAQLIEELNITNLFLNSDPKLAYDELMKIEEASPVIKEIKEFLNQYGHRCPNELECLYPRWEEAPEQVLELISGYLRAGENINPTKSRIRQHQRRIQAQLLVENRKNLFAKTVFRQILLRTQNFTRLRDNGRHYVTKITYPIRRFYAHLGKRWVDRKWLEDADDIFFMTLPEISNVIKIGNPLKTGFHLSNKIKIRKSSFFHWFKVPAPDVIDSNGLPVLHPSKAVVSEWLTGIPASGGRVKGIARIVHDPKEAMNLCKEDILVTRATDPGWTAIFPLIGGLVLEIGGQLSHGAIIAREYGIPAIVNVGNATTRIHEGDEITVDGTSGRVFFSSKKLNDL